jgi:hypothetical protein
MGRMREFARARIDGVHKRARSVDEPTAAHNIAFLYSERNRGIVLDSAAWPTNATITTPTTSRRLRAVQTHAAEGRESRRSIELELAQAGQEPRAD